MIRVSVVAPSADRTSYRLRWQDPITKKRWMRSADTADAREAMRAAARLEEELNSGKWAPRGNIDWKALWDRFQDEVLTGQSPKTRKSYCTAVAWLERLVSPRKAAAITTPVLSDLAAKLRREGKSETTIRTYAKHLRVILHWGQQQGCIATVPALPTIARARKSDGMKGRPITAREMVLILRAVPGVVGQAATASWQHWLKGLWWGGWRLEESLDLYWDRQDKIRPDFSGRFPMISIPYWTEKGKRDRLLPITPEFARFLQRTPERERHGPIFVLRGITDRLGRPPRYPDTRSAEWVGRICSRIGRAAGVQVDVSDSGRIKYASAHDIRRAFGVRWAQRVMPPVLQQLMRHEDIKTTMKYYVSINAEQLAATVWGAYGRAAGASNGSVFGSVARES